MIAFVCSACLKSFSVKDELVGTHGQCPACGQSVFVPRQAVPSPSPVGSSNSMTLPPSSDPDATHGANRPDAGHDPSLTAFLAPSQADDELGRLGKYRILKILGHGGMGVVFKAEDLRLRRSVAIKAMLPGLAANANSGQRFLREAQAMAAVKHDHIATIYQVDEERGIPFLAMEFLVGQPLDQRLERDDELPLPEILRIGREIAEGLEAAHSTGLIHRDIKPANIWLEAPRNRVKILDFGLARAISQDVGLTQQGAIVGTPAYMSPEQARGEALDTRSDLFSLGCLLYRMVTGRLPFHGKDTISTLVAVASYQPPAPVRLNPDVPEELSALVMKLLEKDPERRPASAGEVVRMLEVLQSKPVVRPSAANSSENTRMAMLEPAPKAGARRSRTPLAVALGLLALVPLGWLATVILRVETANGTLVVEMDEEVEARIKGGKLILSGADGKDRYTLTPSEREKKIDAGPYKVRVEGADGLTLDTPEFTLKKGGKVTVRVTAVAKAVAKVGDPDRKAAEYVLSIGETVKVNEQERDIKAIADLPRESFRLTWVDLHQNKQVSDAGLASFKNCTNLIHLNLNQTQVSDAGLAYFKDCKNLTFLGVGHVTPSNISDAGLANFKGCKNLTYLNLFRTQVSDAGLAHFKGCKNLAALGLVDTKVGDAGLAHFENCKNLTELLLSGTKVSNAGLAYFKDCKNLSQLDLIGTQVGDAGLAHLKDCTNLTEIRLNGTKVSNAGLAYFKDRKNLTVLHLTNTKVSDAGLAHLKDCKNLIQLDLSGVEVSDAGLAYFKDCKGLVSLYLANTQVSDADLIHFRDCKNLTHLFLNDTKVGDAGLAHFKDCKGLVHLRLQQTKATAAKIEELKKALPACMIEWDGGVFEPKK